MVALELLAAWLFADFVAGVIHWFEDRYLGEGHTIDFAAGLAADNRLHHDRPTAMLLNSQWDNMRSGALIAWPLGCLLWFAGVPLWLWLGIVLAAFGNVVHRYAHTPRKRLPRVIRGLQEFGLFISPEHHDTHHRYMGRLIGKEDASRAYCPMTDWLNPVLDAVRFWLCCEFVLSLVGLRTVTAEEPK